MIKMDEISNINQLILDTIEEQTDDIYVKKLIKQSLEYELDIWNRYPRKSEIEDAYQRIVEKIVKEMQK
ncbi:MAG: hypothetical protein SCH39_00900 [Methanosarcinales archaeon]|nr:hypothetical protein [Methanosarcinales archaeon]